MNEEVTVIEKAPEDTAPVVEKTGIEIPDVVEKVTPESTDRLANLRADLDRISSGKGSYEIEIDEIKGTGVVHFHGGPKVSECTTLNQNAKYILRDAQNYFNFIQPVPKKL